MARITGTVSHVTSAGNTVNGNTRRRIHLNEGGQVYTTAPDSSAGIDAKNLRPTDPVTLVTNAKGQVVIVNPTD